MYKHKKIISLASLCLALGCAAFSTAQAATRADFYAQFDPSAGVLPFPNNLLFSGSTDGTLNIPVADPKNFADPQVALNQLDGFSTVAPLTANFSGAVNANTLQAGRTVRLFQVELSNPFTNPTTPAPFAITAVQRELRAGVDYQVNLLAQDQKQTTLNIQPLLPLQPKAAYLVVLTNAIQDHAGYDALPSPSYTLTKLPTPLLDGNGNSVIPGLSNAQAKALEPLRQLVNNQENAAASQGLARNNIVLSWTFMTQSTADAFNALGEALRPLGIAVKATGATTQAVGLGLPGFSNIYAGALGIPYYLNKDQPLSSYWQTADGGAVTRYQSLPRATTALQIPLLMTVPNAKSGQSKPATGWPLVIFQHGITGNRTQLFALADALAFEGYAAIAIDLPLHGVTDPSNPFYMRGLERTFDLDLINNTTQARESDGKIDPSGSHFINIASLLTGRDNLRQAAQDLRQLTATLPQLDLNGDGTPDLDMQRIHFIGHSLGGMVGSTFLGTDAQVNINSATLGMAGGGVIKLLDGSPKLGPVIAAGLAASGIIKGTPTYESFLRAAQTVVDAGDPINYAAAAAQLHPIHLIEVVGGPHTPPDQVIPNTVGDAPLAGTEPLGRLMGLQVVNRSTQNRAGLRALVRFSAGDHASLLSPVAAVGVTAEMQGQILSFFNSEGRALEIIYRPVIQP